MAFAAAFLVSLVLAFALTPFADRLAWATGFLDRPAARKLHTSATALLGGPVVFVCALGGWGAARLLAPATFERKTPFGRLPRLAWGPLEQQPRPTGPPVPRGSASPILNMTARASTRKGAPEMQIS